ncbi:MAG: sel1 repeat family protein [Ruminococcaceae bacterium]|nr:sel1 repeat family protein [Oscillospiraceae bacterium]
MNQKEQYDLFQQLELIKRYRELGEGCCGDEGALNWYKLGILYAIKGARYDQLNYEYSYDTKKHCRAYERKGRKLFERAAKCFQLSAEFGNDLAMMNYALYLFAFKAEYEEALKWFLAASEAGLAVADYQLSVFYQNGYCGVAADEERAEAYFTQYQRRCEESERQLMLAWDLDEDRRVIGRAYMFRWFQGISCPELYDTPGASPSDWKYNG